MLAKALFLATIAYFLVAANAIKIEDFLGSWKAQLGNDASYKAYLLGKHIPLVHVELALKANVTRTVKANADGTYDFVEYVEGYSAPKAYKNVTLNKPKEFAKFHYKAKTENVIFKPVDDTIFEIHYNQTEADFEEKFGMTLKAEANGEKKLLVDYYIHVYGGDQVEKVNATRIFDFV